jgi:hypothetical protein
MWPMRGSMAERRRSSCLIVPKTPRFWPEMNTRRGFGASCPRYTLSAPWFPLPMAKKKKAKKKTLEKRQEQCPRACVGSALCPYRQPQERRPGHFNGIGVVLVENASRFARDLFPRFGKGSNLR